MVKIEPRNVWPVERAQRAYQRARTDKAGEAAEKADRVEISPDALALQRLVEEARRLPEVREELVAEVQRRLREGTYRVQAEDLAARLLGKRDE